MISSLKSGYKREKPIKSRLESDCVMKTASGIIRDMLEGRRGDRLALSAAIRRGVSFPRCSTCWNGRMRGLGELEISPKKQRVSQWGR